MAKPNAPTGISVESYGSSNRIFFGKNQETDIKGYNVYYSLTSGGGLSGYVKLNTSLIQNYTEIRQEILNENTNISKVTPTETETTIVDEIVTTTNIKNIINVYYYSYLHDNILEDRIYFYVATAVNYNGEESIYSQEVYAKPLVMSVNIPNIPIRSEDDIVIDLIDTINRKDPTIDLKPGTTIRDLHIDPFGYEMQLAYIRSDFILRAQSFLTLLKLDDDNNDGISDLISESEYKQKLKLAFDYEYDYEVQDMIDFSFDMLASNANIYRKEAEKAVGEITFYTTSSSIEEDITIPIGTIVSTKPSTTYSAVNFVTTIEKVMYKDFYSNYYNEIDQRYEISVNVEAESAGIEGNVAEGTIVVNSSNINLLVTNNNSMSGGTEKEINIDFANRAILAYTSIDVGTARGYKSTAISTSGVKDAFIVSSGDTLMMRDWDDVREKHVYGKVDIFIDGESLTQYTESFNFDYKQNSLEEFLILDANEMRIKCQNVNITSEFPIYSIITIRNVNKAQDYSLDGLVIENDGITLDIDENDPLNSSIGMIAGQIIRVTYKYRDTDPLVLTHQPARNVLSVTGTNSGILSPGTNYIFFRVEDPLLDGNSQNASYYVKIYYNDGKPSGDLQIYSENLMLISYENTSLTKKSVDESTIVIKNIDETITYIKNLDYTITSADYTNNIKIKRVTNSRITSGQTVKISYSYGEEIIISYTVNDLVNIVQNKINDNKKHVTADVLVKEVVRTPIDMKVSVKMNDSNDDPVEVIHSVSAAITNIFTAKKINEGLTQSEIIRSIDYLENVRKCIVPLDKLIKADNSFSIRERLNNVNWQIYQSGTVNSYTTGTEFLNHRTTGYKSDDGFFWGVYEDDVLLTMVETVDEVKNSSGCAFISSDGSVIVSPSDNVDPNPFDHVYDVTYIIFGETGSNDIEVSTIEKIALNNLQISIIRE
ncbi:MAG: baseplate J/gp47 family protein [Acidithiobacillus sp.]|jgi:hypothetical protein|uniref:baseplate J/gp47 family protein n=1 Tax=Acidithiobacillus sp. TaxID=1872118 RepID=UPI00355DBC56